MLDFFIITETWHTQDQTVFLSRSFSEFLSYFMSKFDRVLILGDFNIHVCCPTQGFITDFLDVLDYFNLTQAVNEPTHSKGHLLTLKVIHWIWSQPK